MFHRLDLPEDELNRDLVNDVEAVIAGGMMQQSATLLVRLHADSLVPTEACQFPALAMVQGASGPAVEILTSEHNGPRPVERPICIGRRLELRDQAPPRFCLPVLPNCD